MVYTLSQIFEALASQKTLLVLLAHLTLSFVTTVHILYDKRYNASITAWLGITWLSPFLGAVIYWTIGFNRIHKSQLIYDRMLINKSRITFGTEETLLDQYIANVTFKTSTLNNQISALATPSITFDHMLDCINKAQRSVTLCTYIFDMDSVGRKFVAALSNAHKRGVAVRVLIDGIGAKYSKTSSIRVLRDHGISVAGFLPSMWPWRAPYFNLRNHRKIMVVDGQTAFIGGVNIRHSFEAKHPETKTLQDLHFQVNGPAVTHLQEIFCEDWHFTTKEKLEGQPWFGVPEANGDISVQTIQDGPDENFGALSSIYLAAILRAQKTIRIVTPYFLPDENILEALIIAAKSGVQVQIVVPERNNLKLVQWASNVPLTDLDKNYCEIHLSAPPFDHTKLFVVDDKDCFIGSANWDNRSLMLNFECVLHCKNKAFATSMHNIIDQKISKGKRFINPYRTFRYSPKRLRDLILNLFKGYL